VRYNAFLRENRQKHGKAISFMVHDSDYFRRRAAEARAAASSRLAGSDGEVAGDLALAYAALARRKAAASPPAESEQSAIPLESA
jgi:hypothetical protein